MSFYKTPFYYLNQVFRKVIPKEFPNPIGRWRIDYCNEKINSKIDLSNEDHCGPCGQYAKAKIDSQNRKSATK